MAEDQSPIPESAGDFDSLVGSDVAQMVTELVQLVEAKALAQRLAYKVLVRELSATAGPEVAFRIQSTLDAVRWTPALLSEDDDSLRGATAQELSLLIGELDSLVSGP